MKRIIILALATCMVLGAAFSASAAEYKASGLLIANYNAVDADKSANDTNKFNQRFRSQIDIVTSENLSGTVFFEINNTWGDTASGGDKGTDGTNVQTRRAYVTFAIPSTPVTVKAGLQGLALPSATAGTAIFSDDVAAIVANASFGMIDTTTFFARPYNDDTNDKGIKSLNLYGTIIAANFDAVTVTPYFVYAQGRTQGAADDQNRYYVGAAISAAFGNFGLGLDGMYGSVEGNSAQDQDGYLFAANGTYAFDFAKAGVLAWYASDGNDDDILPSIGDEYGFSPMVLLGESSIGVAADSYFQTVGSQGVALSLEDISLIEKVSHRVAVAWANLDNTKHDGDVWEVDFRTVYNMYDALDVYADLAYANFDGDRNQSDDDVFKAALGVQYNF